MLVAFQLHTIDSLRLSSASPHLLPLLPMRLRGLGLSDVRVQQELLELRQLNAATTEQGREGGGDEIKKRGTRTSLPACCLLSSAAQLTCHPCPWSGTGHGSLSLTDASPGCAGAEQTLPD
jgi:hypothetical protein